MGLPRIGGVWLNPHGYADWTPGVSGSLRLSRGRLGHEWDVANASRAPGFLRAMRGNIGPPFLRAGSGMSVDVNREGRLEWFGYLDWGAILASVFAGLGVTLLLVAFGSAAGIEAADDDGGDETRISSIVGTWTVVSA